MLVGYFGMMTHVCLDISDVLGGDLPGNYQVTLSSYCSSNVSFVSKEPLGQCVLIPFIRL